MNHIITFKEQQKEGKTFWLVDVYKLGMSITGAHFDYTNLFNGNKLLGDNMLKVMNDNWKDVSEGLIGGLEEAYGIILKAMANQLFEKVPIDEIFPK